MPCSLIKKTECPYCSEYHRVQEAWTQATRGEPSRFLNEYILCFNVAPDSTFGAETYTPEGGEGTRFSVGDRMPRSTD